VERLALRGVSLAALRSQRERFYLEMHGKMIVFLLSPGCDLR